MTSSATAVWSSRCPGSFFGIKSYRDNYQSGAIKFGKGLQVGLLITLIASLIYAAVGEMYYQISPDSQLALMDKYADHHINKMKEKGASLAEIDQKVKEMAGCEAPEIKRNLECYARARSPGTLGVSWWNRIAQ